MKKSVSIALVFMGGLSSVLAAEPPGAYLIGDTPAEERAPLGIALAKAVQSPNKKERLTAILLIAELRTGPEMGRLLKKRFERSKDFSERIALAHTLLEMAGGYSSIESRQEAESRFVEVFPTEKQQLGEMWRLTLQNTYLPRLAPFWDAMARIAYDSPDRLALQKLLVANIQTGAAEAEMAGDALAYVFNLVPERFASVAEQMDDKVYAHALEDIARYADYEKFKRALSEMSPAQRSHRFFSDLAKKRFEVEEGTKRLLEEEKAKKALQ